MASPNDAAAAYLPHILRTTLDSLSLLTSSGAISPSPELDRVKSQLQDSLHAANFGRLSVEGSSSAPPQHQQHQQQGLPASTLPLPNLPPRRTPSHSTGSSTYSSSADPYPVNTASPAAASQSNTSFATSAPTAPIYHLPPPPSQQQRSLARALWDYHASEPDDLSFRKGDTIIIVEEVNPQWYRGKVDNGDPNGRTGLFPENYVEKIASPPSLPPHHQQATAGGGWNEKQQQQQQQPPPPAGYPSYSQPPPPPPAAPQQQLQQMTSQQQEEAKKQGRFGKFASSGLGNTLVHSAVGGFGFGAGSAVAGDIVHSIF